jgi:(S)-mandelate dehydrogenase
LPGFGHSQAARHPELQQDIPVAARPLAGRHPPIVQYGDMPPGAVDDYRHRARTRLPRFVFDYIEGGADLEDCLARNVSDLRRVGLVPTCLRDTRTIDTSIEVFGCRWKAPVGIAPTGLNGLIRPDGDILLAKAAARAGIPFVLSTASNARLEAVSAATSGGINWLQLYVMNDRAIAEQLVRRARSENYNALVVTVDVPTNGNRRRDIRNGFGIPFRPGLRTLLNILTYPGWVLRIVRHGLPSFVNLTESQDKAAAAQLGAALLAREMDRGFVWESLGWLRDLWDGPLLLKGILHPDDANQAERQGIDGLIVSNHGGRQLDAAPSAFAALAPIIDAVGGRIPVFVDGGFRTGDDIVKALAVGARAVFIGRPALYGLACGAESGVDAVVSLLLAQIMRTMILIGAADVSQVDRKHLMPA